MKQFSFPVEGMTCASCVARVEKIISKVDGVEKVSVNLAKENVTFSAEENVDLNFIASLVDEYGYKLLVKQKENPAITDNQNPNEESDLFYYSLKKDFLLALILTLPVFAITMLMDFDFFHHNWPLSSDYTNKLMLILTTPIIFISGKRFFESFAKNIRHFSFEMNSLVAIGTAAAYGYSLLATLFPAEFSINNKVPHVYFETSGVIITLILMGKLLEHKAKRKTNDAVKKLIALQPSTARIIKNGNEVEVLLNELKINDIVIIRPGEKIPADGEIVIGASSINESMITGESIPVEKEIGSKVIGGTININGTFNFCVSQVGDQTILAQIIRFVENAQATKPPIQKLVDKVAAVFVPVVIVIAAATFFVWLFLGSENNFVTALINFVSVLIVACPCALGLATPTAIIVGTGLGATKGILIRDGESLESAQKISTIVFDKTGTLTEGKPFVTNVVSIEIDEDELIKYSASLENKSEHPIARAITDFAKQKNLQLIESSSFNSVTGFGITGVINNKFIVIGNKKFLEANSIDVSKYNSLSSTTQIFTAVDSELKGIFTIEDKLKNSSVEAVNSLSSMKIKSIMLTGDNKATAEKIARQVGLTNFYAEVLPQEKANIIKQLQGENEFVAMVGDGINDAPALAQANIGIAIGSGTDIAIETAQITLVKGDLRNVAHAIKLSKQTLKTIKQNLFWAFIYNIILIPLAALGKLNPMIAALAMSLSSVSVVTNSLRLKRTKF